MHPLKTLVRSWLTRSFQPFRFTDQNDTVLFYRDAEKLGLYIHIPFCRTLCAFCPYCKVVYDRALATQYVDALLREIDQVGRMNGGEKKVITSLYFGGGTPALCTNELKSIINQIHRYFVITDGIGLELHPEDVTEETLDLIRKAGVTKISIGVQSFQPDNAKRLGRDVVNPQRLAQALQTVSFETISMDFIFALPGQTIQQIRADIETAYSIGANLVALYPFIDFTFTRSDFPVMDEAAKKQLLYDMVDYCAGKGYQRNSLWTFSKDASAKYSSMTRENFLGFGCSATTLLNDQFKINTFNPSAYISRINQQELPTALTLKFTRRQRMVYYLFWTAYSMHIDPIAFRDFFDSHLSRNYGFEFFLAHLLGFLKKEQGVYTLTTKGSYFYHLYEYDYTLAYIDQMWSNLRLIDFPHEMVIK